MYGPIITLQTRGSGVDSGTRVQAASSWVRFPLSFDLSLQHYGHGVKLVSKRIEYQEYSWASGADKFAAIYEGAPTAHKATGLHGSFF
jgi:hypothetical protein